LDEFDLIQRLKQKEESAFRWLVEYYRNRVFHTVLNILQDAKEAEDTAQDTFIQVYESIASFKGESSIATWIHQIAVRKALEKIRKQKAKKRIQALLPWWMPEENKSLDALFLHPGIAMEKKEKAAILFKAIETLPEKQRLAFTLIKVQGMNYDEACAILQQNVKAVESLISRAKVNLQKKLERNYNT
jgi:RNA polymerase sigma factor (sigma-70 family)